MPHPLYAPHCFWKSLKWLQQSKISCSPKQNAKPIFMTEMWRLGLALSFDFQLFKKWFWAQLTLLGFPCFCLRSRPSTLITIIQKWCVTCKKPNNMKINQKICKYNGTLLVKVYLFKIRLCQRTLCKTFANPNPEDFFS